MAIRTKSIYEPKEETDGLRVLITRYYPRGVKKDRFDRWVKDLSPSVKLLKSHRNREKTWDQFRAEFISEMKGSSASQDALRELGKESRKSTVTLLCYEKAGLPCHRTIVAELVSGRRTARIRRAVGRSRGRAHAE